MADLPSKRKCKFGIASAAPESVNVPRSVSRSVQDRRFVVCPTTGTLQIAPDYRDKAAKALMREVRRMRFGLKLQLLRLYFRQFALNLRRAALIGESYFVGNFSKLASERCHWHISPSALWKKVCTKLGLLSSPGYSPFFWHEQPQGCHDDGSRFNVTLIRRPPLEQRLS